MTKIACIGLLFAVGECQFKEPCDTVLPAGSLYGPCNGWACSDGGACGDVPGVGNLCITPETNGRCPEVPLNVCGLPLGIPEQDTIGRCFFVCGADADCPDSMVCVEDNFGPGEFSKTGICVWPFR